MLRIDDVNVNIPVSREECVRHIHTYTHKKKNQTKKKSRGKIQMMKRTEEKRETGVGG